ncbi:MAG: hypothetical protein HY791_07000 [Deltaproteobacteria bacterium]|nr:hypothetical protein [Deltaproteobacteria bacterium]
MAIRVKLGAGESHIEHQQMEARLEALGLELNPDRTLDERSAKNVAGGLAAIQKLSEDGVLTADSVAKLRRQTSLIGKITGMDVPITDKATRDWKALGMEMSGTAQTLSSINSEISRTGTINNSLFHRAGARFEQLEQRLNSMSALKPDTEKLAKVDPRALRSVASSAKAMTQAATDLQSTLSQFRSVMMDAVAKAQGPKFRLEAQGDGYTVHERPGWFTRVQIDALAGSLNNALQGLPVIAQLGEAFSINIGSSGRFDQLVARSGAQQPSSVNTGYGIAPKPAESRINTGYGVQRTPVRDGYGS